MGCGASFRAAKTHPAPLEQTCLPVSIVPDADSPVKGTTDVGELAELQDVEGEEQDDGDDDDDSDEESDDSIPGEPMEAKWARAAKRKKRLARQRRRAAQAAKEGIAVVVPSSINRFAGMRRPCSKTHKENCFDRECLLASSTTPVDEIYDLSINLGKGTFGTVERCKHRKTEQTRALKTIAKKKVYDCKRLTWEVEIMRMLEHPHILKLYESFEDDKYLYIVMELCTGGELLDKLLSLDGGGLTEKAVAKVMRQVFGAVFYMHQQFICHRDLKPENFLLMHEVENLEDAQIKVIDFGFSTLFQPGDFMSTLACTTHYVAPEVLDSKYTEACDIWSLGVIIYVLLSGQKPFHGATEKEALVKVKSCTYDFEDPPCWSSVSTDAKDLIQSILVLDFSKRVTAEMALQHCWITQLAPRASPTSLPQEVFTRLGSFHAMGKFQRAAMTAMAQQMPESSIQELRKVFQALDENEDGSLSLEELDRGLKAADIDIPHWRDLLQHVDTDGSGRIEYTEFLASTLDKRHVLEEAACWAAFRVFDMDGDGKITKEEMAMMLSCGSAGELADSLGADRAEIEKTMLEADLDGDGRLDFSEFKALLLSSCSRQSQALPNMTQAPPAG